jgi:small subunit ribosomal protein S15
MNNKSKQEVIAPFKKHETDSGSSSVQVAILTARISELTEHLKKFKKDFASKRSLIIMVDKRKKLLRYVEKHEGDSYKSLLAKLNIRK